jgi:hypothetical protein
MKSVTDDPQHLRLLFGALYNILLSRRHNISIQLSVSINITNSMITHLGILEEVKSKFHHTRLFVRMQQRI